MDWNEIARSHQVDKETKLFLTGVSAHVYWRAGTVFINHIGTTTIEVIDHAKDRLLVSRNNARGEHHRIARLDACVLVVIDGSAREGGHRFALCAADKNADFLRIEVTNLTGMDERAFGNVQVSEIERDLRRFVHRATDERELASVLEGHIRDELDAMDR